MFSQISGETLTDIFFDNKQNNPPSIRSFVRRFGRMTSGQKKHLNINSKQLIKFDQLDPNPNWHQIFGIQSDTRLKIGLDIGFGMGDGTIALANNNPEVQLLSVDIHKPGIGRVLRLLDENKIKNVRIIEADVIDLLIQKIADNTFSLIKILFPDPWPKTRHHKRRLINQKFIELLALKAKTDCLLHIATDNQNYHNWILQTMSSQNKFQPFNPNLNPKSSWLDCFPSKFYQRAINEGRIVFNQYYINNG